MYSCSYTKLSADEDIEIDGSSDPIKPKYSHLKRKPACCWLKILIKVVVITTLLFLVAASLVGIHAYKWIAKEVEKWTVTHPHGDIPVVVVPQEELKAFKADIHEFYKTIQHDKTPKDLVVPARTLNGLISYSHSVFSGNAFVEMSNNDIGAVLSLPMDGFPGGKGRFLNGGLSITWHPKSSELRVRMESMSGSEPPFYGTFKPFFDMTFLLTRIEDDKLSMELISGEILDRIVPQDFIDEHINLLEDMYNCKCHDKDCKRTRKVLLALDNILLEDDQVVVKTQNTHMHMHRNLGAGMDDFIPSNRPGWKFDVGRRLVKSLYN